MTGDRGIGSQLSEGQVEDFARNGWLFLPGFFDPAQIREITAWTDEIAAWPEIPGRHMVYKEESQRRNEGRILQRIEDLTPYHAGFRSLFTDGSLLEAVSQLLGEKAVLFKDKINFKLPGGGGFKVHQDAQAGWHSYADFFISALVSIDRSSAENGCLEMASGWHRDGLIGKEWEPLSEDLAAKMDFMALPTDPGDVVLFDCYAPHRSGDNLTDDPRRLLYVTYNRASQGDHRARYFADKREAFPPDIEREPGKVYVFRV